MSFIGIVSDSKKFDILKKILQNVMNKNEFNIININKRSINNLKNVKFDAIVFLELINNIELEAQNLQGICKDIRYLIVNSDVKFEEDFLPNIETNIISFGLNHLSTVTISSVTDENILISVQRNFQRINGEIVDVGEYSVPIDKFYRNFLYEVLVSFILYG